MAGRYASTKKRSIAEPFKPSDKRHRSTMRKATGTGTKSSPKSKSTGYKSGSKPRSAETQQRIDRKRRRNRNAPKRPAGRGMTPSRSRRR